ncbi:MAG: hypothetical protein KGQ36_02695 [Rickettsiales bacterium]|nr:hypothetical protein [Rickettsiales bacterium]
MNNNNLLRDKLIKEKNSLLEQGPMFKDPLSMDLALSFKVFEEIFGKDRIKSNGIYDNLICRFIKHDLNYDEIRQIIIMADNLYLLRNEKNFELFLNSFTADQLRSKYLELEGANFFLKNGFNIEFVIRKGVKGEDFDFIVRKEDLIINVEVKDRINSREINKNTLSNVLNDARKQLPKNSVNPNLVLIEINDEWTFSTEMKDLVNNVVEDFFRVTKRVSGIIIIWNYWELLENNKINLYKMHTVENKNASNLINLDFLKSGCNFRQPFSSL